MRVWLMATPQAFHGGETQRLLHDIERESASDKPLTAVAANQPHRFCRSMTARVRAPHSTIEWHECKGRFEQTELN